MNMWTPPPTHGSHHSLHATTRSWTKPHVPKYSIPRPTRRAVAGWADLRRRSGRAARQSARSGALLVSSARCWIRLCAGFRTSPTISVQRGHGAWSGQKTSSGRGRSQLVSSVKTPCCGERRRVDPREDGRRSRSAGPPRSTWRCAADPGTRRSEAGYARQVEMGVTTWASARALRAASGRARRTQRRSRRSRATWRHGLRRRRDGSASDRRESAAIDSHRNSSAGPPLDRTAGCGVDAERGERRIFARLTTRLGSLGRWMPARSEDRARHRRAQPELASRRSRRARTKHDAVEIRQRLPAASRPSTSRLTEREVP